MEKKGVSPVSWTRQLIILFRLFWTEKRGEWKITLVEILVPIYPALLFWFFLATGLFSASRVEIPGVNYYPPTRLEEVSLKALQIWQFNPGLLGFSPSQNEELMSIAADVCDLLEVDFSRTEKIPGGHNNNFKDYTSSVIVDFTDVNEFTMVTPDGADLSMLLQYSNMTETGIAVIDAGIVYLQSAVNTVLLEREGISVNVTFQTQKLPTDARVDTFNMLKFMLPLMFIGSLFYCFRSLLLKMGIKAEKGVREAMELKGLNRNAMWLSYWAGYSILTILSSWVLTPLLYLIGLLKFANAFHILLLFTLYAVAQTAFGILVLCLVGDKWKAKSIFGLAAFGFILIQVLFFVFELVILPKKPSELVTRLLFLLYILPFGHVLSTVTETELLETGLSTSASTNVWWAYGMLFIDGIIYVLIGVGYDSYRQRSKTKNLKSNDHVDSVTESQLIEGNGIVIRNLVKEFVLPLKSEKGEKPELAKNESELPNTAKFRQKKKLLRAVDGLSLDVKKNEIFCLLGHNGAGKTTTFNCLIGSLAATSGNAWIHGLNIFRDRTLLRKSIGVCPQQDIVHDDATCHQQLVFIGEVAGLNFDEATKESKRLLEKLGLNQKADEYARNLSGGQKRRLSLALALIGSPPVIVLDEPTTGLDPDNRRKVWMLLQELKQKHTVIMTTHSLEEADALGDTIAIMADGKLQVIGSSLELKRKHGSGYSLNCLRKIGSEKEFKVEKLQEKLMQYVDTIKLISSVGAEISFALAADQAKSFPDLFQYLENGGGEEHGLQSFGLSPTTLEDVFLNLDVKHEIGSKNDVEETNADENSDQKHLPDPLKSLDEENCKPTYSRQIAAIAKQTLTSLRRNPLSTGVLIIQPIIFTIIFVFVGRSLQPGESQIFPINGSNVPFAFHNNIDDEILLGTGPELSNASNLYQFLNTTKLDEDNIGGICYDDIEYNVSKLEISAEITLVLNQNNDMSPQVLMQSSYSVIAKMFNVSQNLVSGLARPSEYGIHSWFGGGAMSYFVALSFTSQAASFAVEMSQSRHSGAKQMLLLSGLPRWIYWLGHMLIHLIIVFIPATCIYLVLYISETGGANDTSIVPFIALAFCFGFPSILYGYCVSFVFDDEEAVQQFAGESQVVMLIPWVMVTTVFESPKLWFENLFTALVPGFGVYRGLAIISTASSNGAPLAASDAFDWDQQFCQVLVFLLLSGVFYGFILFVVESNLRSRYARYRNNVRIRNELNKIHAVDAPAKNEIDKENRDAVLQGILPSPVSAIPDTTDILKIRCENACKKFVLKNGKVFTAVHMASLGVEKNSIFGLLGPNGAGKTTLIKCLTGLDGGLMDSGHATIEGYSTAEERSKVLPLMGICPQFDALIGLLTGREILTMFATIRGVPVSKVASVVQSYLDLLHLTPKADARCKTYSGGNKRRLSVALSIIASPRAIFMDEPSTGLDPTTRRKLWKFLKLKSSSEEKTSRAILLTTHSMEEAEALCSRIAIMVQSSIRTIGSTQQLKTYYGGGTLVTLGINNKSDLKRIEEAILSVQPKSICQDSTISFVKYFLPSEGTSWTSIFKVIMDKQEEVGIIDFAVSQRSLEDVFVDFANLQQKSDE